VAKELQRLRPAKLDQLYPVKVFWERHEPCQKELEGPQTLL